MARPPRRAAAVAFVAVAALILSACGGKSPDDSGADTGLAQQILADAGVSTPVELKLQYNGDHYGSSSDQEYATIKSQLEATGLFKVELQQTEWVTYNQQRTTDYPVFQLGWFPDFPDADNYLTPFFSVDNFLHNGFSDDRVTELLDAERTNTDPDARNAVLAELQIELAKHMPTVPLLQGSQVAVTGLTVTGVDKTLDASFQFRFAPIVKDDDGTAVIKVGTTDKITALDPAGSYDNGSYNVHYQVYPFVLGFAPGNPSPVPDLAESCEFTNDGSTYSCTIRAGLTWANGNTLDANDVKHSYDRQLAIADENGPSSLLENLASVECPDDLTVNFNLTSPNDVTFPQVLASPVGPIVDNDVFPADALVADDDIVAANAFAGPYTITSYRVNELIEYTPNPAYVGAQGAVANGGATMKYYADESNMRLEIEQGAIDVAHRSLSPTDIQALEDGGKVNVVRGPGGEIRYIVFNLDIQPGETPEQKVAIRKAVAASIDRHELAEAVYKNTYTPLCSFVPDGLPGANTAVCDAYGGN